MIRRAAVLLAGVSVVTAACTRQPSLRAAWTGADSGQVILPARAAWCGRKGPLLLFAARGDTGIALAVYPTDSLAAGEFPIADAASGVIRPGAALAARWVRKLMVSDLRATRGRLTLQSSAGTIAGHFSAHAEGMTTTTQVALDGRFAGIPVVRGGPDCTGYPGVD